MCIRDRRATARETPVRDNKRELLALTRMPEEEQRRAVEAVRAGEAKSVRKKKPPREPAAEKPDAPEGPGGLVPTGETFTLPADQVLTAIGQTLEGAPEGLVIEDGKIRVEGPGRTDLHRVWAGGDCALGGQDLTVAAVAAGRDAAMDIHAALASS